MTRLLSGAILLTILGAPCIAEETNAVEMRYRSYRNWSIQLPAEKWFPVKDGIHLPHAGDAKFAVEIEGNNLRFDTDGDGELDRTIKPLVDAKTNVSSTRVILSGTKTSGEEFRYAARLRKDAKGWEWAPGGAMAGSIPTDAGPMPVRIIDRDGNGRFSDIGSDAIIVGTGDYATLLSKTIFVNDALQDIAFNEDSTSITLAKYEGPTAQIDMATSFNSKAVLLSAVIVSADKQHSFDIGAIEGAVTVPAGTYTVVSGSLGLGDHRVQITAGRMKPIKLAPKDSQEFDWGGPVESEFRYVRAGDKVQFSPQQIWFYGKAGEQYAGWNPIGKSPEFRIRDADSGAVLEVAILPGSC